MGFSCFITILRIPTCFRILLEMLYVYTSSVLLHNVLVFKIHCFDIYLDIINIYLNA